MPKQTPKTDYDRIARALRYLETHAKDRPSLERVAREVGLSPAHFQRLFTRFAGVSPKKFLQYLSLSEARKRLAAGESALQAAFHAGLSGSGRLHDLFVSIEGMTPGEYKAGGRGLSLEYQFAATPFGRVLVASSARGVVAVLFADHKERALTDLKRRFPQASYKRKATLLQEEALACLRGQGKKARLHLKGTPFQLKVWEALLSIPPGALAPYSAVAQALRRPKALRAVGAAVGQNPIAVLIPCHRVIQKSGAFGGYHWESARKQALIGWEAARREASL
jgi:AraC family transcriptional regulator of adaptative response/methylated-DNA-[protein]-cysteine methyltransferase